MIRAMLTSLTLLLIMVLISSCASEDIFKTFKIDQPPETKHIAADKVAKKMLTAADQEMISDLKTQLATAKENETVLNDRIIQLKQEIVDKDSEFNAQIVKLKKEIEEKDNIISIHGKVIGLLDDADQTLQKSIETQINSN